MNVATAFRNTTAQGIRAAEVPGASFLNGMNSGNMAPGVGIATDNPELQESLFAPTNGGALGDSGVGSWSLLDQFGAARIPQVGQVVGGTGVTPEAGYPSSGGVEGNGDDQAQFIVGVANPIQSAKDADPSLDGTVIVLGTANLQSLATGWELL